MSTGPVAGSDLPPPPDDPEAAAFWWFALALYDRPHIGAQLLAWQDEAGADVNMILLSCWLGAVRRRRLSARSMTALMAAGRDWHERVVVPLRRVRRQAKIAGAGDGAPAAMAYQRLKAAELAAEQVHQGQLVRALPAQPAGPAAADAAAAVRDNLDAYSQAAGLAEGCIAGRERHGLVTATLATAERVPGG